MLEAWQDEPDESGRFSPADSGIFSFSDRDSGEEPAPDKEPAGDTKTKVDNHPGQDDSSDSGMLLWQNVL